MGEREMLSSDFCESSLPDLCAATIAFRPSLALPTVFFSFSSRYSSCSKASSACEIGCARQ